MADGSGYLDFGQELVVDLFAGGGGASTGLAEGYREPDVAVNHNPVAVAVHAANHPRTKHYTCDVFEVDPIEATGGLPTGLLWASPDCRHFSRAAGAAPRSKKVRALADVVIKWAEACLPRIIHLENVVEFLAWNKLTEDGRPCEKTKGLLFRRWARKLEDLGYEIEWRELVAADFGAPTIRKRLYLIARRDGRPIVWPKPTHHKTGANGLKPWRSAAECIDFTLPSKSIFDRKKPLVLNTRRRIAKGLWRFLFNTETPFLVPAAGADSFDAYAPHLTEHANGSSQRVFDAQEPLRTQVAQIKGGHFAMAAACLTTLRGTSASHINATSVDAPLGAVSAQGTHHGLIAAHITKYRQNSIGTGCDEPFHTITAGGAMKRPAGAAHAMGLVSAFLEQANGGYFDGDGRDLRQPVSTVCTSGANQRLVSAYLVKYYGQGGQWADCREPMHTVPCNDRMGLVQAIKVEANTLAPHLRDRARAVAHFLHEHLPEHFPEKADMVLIGNYVLADITLRMLVPRELARAQGFPDSYIIDRQADGTPVTKTDQVKLIGNSVCPDVARALVRANAADLIELYERQAA